jgi:thioesterase domain-containing protein
MARAEELRAGPGPALWLIHSSTGDVECYRPLAAALGGVHRVVGIAPRGLRAGDEPPLDDLVDLARRYAALIADAEPGVPHRVAGWALGGVVAAEVAEQLLDAGHRVDFLAVLDGRVPVPEMRARPLDRATIALAFAHHVARSAGRELATAAVEPTGAAVLDALRALDVAPAAWTAEDVDRRIAVMQANARALFHHAQRRLRVPLHLYESAAEHPAHPRPRTLGWEAHAEVIRETVPGHHFDLLAGHHIGPLAARLTTALAALTSPRDD